MSIRGLALGTGCAVLAAVSLSSHAVLQARSQSPSPQTTFRSSTNLVEVDVVVHDKQGRFVPGLTADDLEVFEDGKRQAIQQFYLVASTGSSVVPASRQTGGLAADPRGHRIFVFLFDNEHLNTQSLLRVKSGVERFLETQFRPGDVGGIFTNGAMYDGRLTTDRNELLRGLHAVQPAFQNREDLLLPFREWPALSSENDAERIDYGDTRLLDDLTADACAARPGYCDRAGNQDSVRNQIENKARDYLREARSSTSRTLQTLRLVAGNLSTVPGRKTVVFLSNGFFTDESRGDVQEIAAIAARGGTTFYGVYGRGASVVAGRAEPDSVTAEPSLVTAFDTVDDGPEILTGGTGGFVVRNIDNVSRALSMVASDTSTYYVLGYQPDAAMDGKVHKIEVKATTNGLKVRARKGYVASPLPPMQTVRIGGGL
jgi:VWFA-related protein